MERMKAIVAIEWKDYGRGAPVVEKIIVVSFYAQTDDRMKSEKL